MAGFYVAEYQGVAGGGGGAFYIGNEIITGADVAGGVYNGGYEEVAGRLFGIAKLGIPGGGQLVTGRRVGNDETVEVRFNLPTLFDNGQAHPVSVEGAHVMVVFRKVRDLP